MERIRLEQRFRALSGFRARSRSDFERSVASKEIEDTAQALFFFMSSALWYGARLSNDFDGTMLV